ncbi:NlpC/P60 family protein [Pedococcus bigeumensis]|uniref:NlpC/P60 family protein n=1 Tax=Pedococcus bigeumensis TaxID=433644 RepID=A0A502CNS7_9MICO|nr:NlpC/P60 family protein [Pedococcus bigeumensis]TPG14877.1 NlpC/P60 family protein [Pedococcus bigeumensis]
MPNAHSARRALRTGATLCMVGILAGTTALSASADPDPVYPSKAQVDKAQSAVATTSGKVSSLDAQYAAASAQLSQVQDRAGAAAEAYNGAVYELDKRTAETTAAKKRAAQAQEVADAAALQVRRYAASVYQQGGNLGELEAYLSSTGPQDLMDRATALEAVSDARTRTLQQAAASSIVADTMRQQAAGAEAAQAKAAKAAEDARNAAQAQADQAEAAAAQIQQEQNALTVQLATLRKTSVDLEKQRQDGLAAAAVARAAAAEAARQARLAAERAKAARTAAARKAAQQAAARAAAEAARQKAAAEAAEKAAEEASQQQNHPKPKPKPDNPPPPPPSTNGGVSAVIGYARSQIGKPYQWGGSGPNSFDCSGLTMRAWQRAGVNLSHYTGAQWGETSRVAISDLRPGDLVFYGDSGPTSHHVGLYIGGGQMIEAPYTGANVRYASIYRSDLVPYGGRP